MPIFKKKPPQQLNNKESIHQLPTHKTPVLVFVLLLGFFVVGIWVMQHSVNAYYVQTYHKPSVLVLLDKYKLWSAGGQIGKRLYAWRDDITQQITDYNEQTMLLFNQYYAFDQAYIDQQKQKEQQLLQLKALADEQDKQKNKYTLTAGDSIFFAGDSMMQGVAPHLQQRLQKQGIHSINLSKQSTGLAYPKLFDWQKTIQTTLADNPAIKILVVFLGPNDPWDIPDPNMPSKVLSFNSNAWNGVYQARMKDILDNANLHNVSVIWITPPNMKKNKLNEQMIILNDIMADELARHDVMVIDSRQLLKTDNNIYNDYTDNEGKSLKMRSGDGIHFTPQGQKFIANFIYSQLTID